MVSAITMAEATIRRTPLSSMPVPAGMNGFQSGYRGCGVTTGLSLKLSRTSRRLTRRHGHRVYTSVPARFSFRSQNRSSTQGVRDPRHEAEPEAMALPPGLTSGCRSSTRPRAARKETRGEPMLRSDPAGLPGVDSVPACT
jgi:hypothetical protein